MKRRLGPAEIVLVLAAITFVIGMTHEREGSPWFEVGETCCAPDGWGFTNGSTKMRFVFSVTNVGGADGRPDLRCDLAVRDVWHEIVIEPPPSISAGETRRVSGKVLVPGRLGYRILDDLEPFCRVPKYQSRSHFVY